MISRKNSRFALFFVALVCATFLGCKPQIGDSCQLSTDCSSLNDRLCDLSMPGGYCTVFNCEPNSCPDAQCVEFHPQSERFSRRFCAKGCSSDADCREGYVCVIPATRDAKIIDVNPDDQKVCLP